MTEKQGHAAAIRFDRVLRLSDHDLWLIARGHRCRENFHELNAIFSEEATMVNTEKTRFVILTTPVMTANTKGFARKTNVNETKIFSKTQRPFSAPLLPVSSSRRKLSALCRQRSFHQ